MDTDEKLDELMNTLEKHANGTQDISEALDCLLMLYTIYAVHDCDDFDAYKIIKIIGLLNDKNARGWMIDYENYVRKCEHGNESAMTETGLGFYITAITDSHQFEYVIDYLLSENEYSDTEAKNLAIKLLILHKKYKNSI